MFHLQLQTNVVTTFNLISLFIFNLQQKLGSQIHELLETVLIRLILKYLYTHKILTSIFVDWKMSEYLESFSGVNQR
jgi:hypothetical protein